MRYGTHRCAGGKERGVVVDPALRALQRNAPVALQIGAVLDSHSAYLRLVRLRIFPLIKLGLVLVLALFVACKTSSTSTREAPAPDPLPGADAVAQSTSATADDEQDPLVEVVSVSDTPDGIVVEAKMTCELPTCGVPPDAIFMVAFESGGRTFETTVKGNKAVFRPMRSGMWKLIAADNGGSLDDASGQVVAVLVLGKTRDSRRIESERREVHLRDFPQTRAAVEPSGVAL